MPKLAKLGDQVQSIMFEEAHGIIGIIKRDTEDKLTFILEYWNDEVQDIVHHSVKAEEARDVDGGEFIADPYMYDEYFPQNEDGTFKFKLNVKYGDIYTDLKGIARSHSVCITGCDRTGLEFYKRNKGVYTMGTDLNRIKEIKDEPTETTDNSVNENRRQPGDPLECSKNEM